MRVVVVGAGAVGAYFGARLLQAGHAVRLVARGEHGAALAGAGLRLVVDGKAEQVGPFVVGSLKDAAGFDADVALVAVKAGALAEVASGLAACLAEQGAVVPLLNGVQSEAQLAAELGVERVIAAVAYMAGQLTAPGELAVAGLPRAGLAPYRCDADVRLEPLARQLEVAGIPTIRHVSAGPMLWQKMLWNVPFNALCGLTGLRAGKVLADPELLELATTCMAEVHAVAASQGAALAPQAVDATLTITRTQFPRTVPSMLQDLRAGRPTEVEILQGAVVRLGRAAGVPTPVTGMLAALVRGRERASAGAAQQPEG